MDSILNLEKRIQNLKNIDENSYKILNQIYSFNFGSGTLRIPESFENKILQYFGHRNERGDLTETLKQVIKRIENQKIINIYNKWTGEGALFNSLRTNRPGMNRQNMEKENKKLDILIKDSMENCDFCQPDKFTPEEEFGRVLGKYSITASNIAKYDVWSGLVIFKRHNPLKFSLSEVSDYITTAFNWFDKVYQQNKQYKYPFFVWNCLYKAGASQTHGHAQVLMAKNQPYAKIEDLRIIRQKYKNIKGRDYLEDMVQAHRCLGLAHKVGDIDLIASITPVKEKETIIISPLSPSKSNKAKKVIYNTLRCFIDILGVYSFNLSISSPPMDGEYETPYLIHLVDRGSLFKPTTDMGGMELFGSTVLGDDPYKVIHHLKDCL